MCFFFSCYGDHPDLHVLAHSFPTLLSSDLSLARAIGDEGDGGGAGLIELAGELAVDGVGPACGGDLVTGAGIARCFPSPVPEVIAVTQRNKIGRAHV